MTIDRYRTIHIMWVGAPIPEEYARNIELWRELHPDWDMKIWRDDDFGWLDHQDIYDAAEQWVPSRVANQLRSDIARYEILHREGGLWVDADTRPLKPVDAWVRNRREFAVMETATMVGNTYLGSVPGHRLFDSILGGLRYSIERGRWHRLQPNRMSGPGYITPIWKTHEGYTAPTPLFFPYLYSDVKRGTVPETFGDDVVAVHSWNNTRKAMSARGRRSTREPSMSDGEAKRPLSDSQ